MDIHTYTIRRNIFFFWQHYLLIDAINFNVIFSHEFFEFKSSSFSHRLPPEMIDDARGRVPTDARKVPHEM